MSTSVFSVEDQCCIEDYSNNIFYKGHILRLASWLNDPICKVHEFYRRSQVLDSLYPNLDSIEEVKIRAFHYLAIIGFGVLALITTLPGVLLRGLVVHLQNEPYIEVKTNVPFKELTDEKKWSLLSWNICCVAGGYSISDGGVSPWAFRIDQIVSEIESQDADVVCLYETLDSESAFQLQERLKDQYSHFYYCIGPKTVGVSSGIFVASKYEVFNPEFSPFDEKTLVGRTKNASKGVFGFSLRSNEKSFARVYATHPQHSDCPSQPTQEEINSRKQQFEFIEKTINEGPQVGCTVLTGDLNLDENEFNQLSISESFQKGAREDLAENKTWGGDLFCKQLTGGVVSGPVNLDYTRLHENSSASIETEVLDNGFDPYDLSGVSDHKALLSYITV